MVDTVPVAQKVTVVEGPNVYTHEGLCININTPFGRFYNSYYKSLKVCKLFYYNL